ncbi:arginine--tRNA ligase [soil metagenome]
MLLLSLKEELNKALKAAIRAACGDALQDHEIPFERCVFGPTKQPEHGDLATSAALMLAKPLGKNPMQVAQEIAEKLTAHPYIVSAEAVKPGFVNLRLGPEAISHVLTLIARDRESYGDSTFGRNAKVLLEFVSANPTGPMHLGHCRHAATGDALARILRAASFIVTTEFYVNDAGVQIQALGRSFRYRCLAAVGAVLPSEVEDRADDEGRPRTFFQGEAIQYTGEYLDDFAKDFVKGKTKEELLAMSIEDFSKEARDRNLEMIKRDLASMGVLFDSFVSEKALHDAGAVAETLEKIREHGGTYEKDGALFLRTAEFGDEQDRVMVKSDGAYTYLVPDVAYHHVKFQRAFDRYINVFGADHGGYPPRLRAGIAAMGHDEKKLDVLLLRLVFLTKNNARVKFSKRAGNFVALSDVVEEAGADATRWFVLWRSMDSEFEFDMDLARQHSSQNPVFKVQYAHARICSVQRKAVEGGFEPLAIPSIGASRLVAPIEREMVLYLSQFPEIVDRSARELAVHHIPGYLLGLADLWNRYWSMAKTDESFRILRDDNRDLTAARLTLADAIRQVLANGLGLLGISAPNKMSRDEEEG